jgi:hypothetical protein
VFSIHGAEYIAKWIGIEAFVKLDASLFICMRLLSRGALDVNNAMI